jgi:hypothetical protein
MDNNTTTSTESTTTTSTTPEKEVIEHVEAEVVCPGYSPLGTAPETLLNLFEGGFYPIF